MLYRYRYPSIPRNKPDIYATHLTLTVIHTVHSNRPSDPGGHFNLATCLDALGERQAALGCFERAFALQPCMAEAAANAAGILMQTGDAERACSLCYQVRYADRTRGACLRDG